METDFASVTRSVLKAYAYSEADLARELGVSQPTVHRIKTGAVKNPGFATGAKLLDLLKRSGASTGAEAHSPTELPPGQDGAAA